MWIDRIDRISTCKHCKVIKKLLEMYTWNFLCACLTQVNCHEHDALENLEKGGDVRRSSSGLGNPIFQSWE
jgi:hypothetical protein